MKKLILARHGEYDSDERLNDEGRSQIERLAKKLKPRMEGFTVLLLASPLDRTRQSAEMIGNALGIAFEDHKALYSDHYHGNFSALLTLIRSRANEADVLILVTHAECAEDFPEYFGKQELQHDFRPRIVGYGQAQVIDCEQKTIALL